MASKKNSDNIPKFNAETMQHIIRIFNTNINGKKKIAFALTQIRGIGNQMANAIVTQAKVDKRKFAGELNSEEINKLLEVINDPLKHGIPRYYLNHLYDNKTGEDSHLVGSKLDAVFRQAIEAGKKIGHVRKCRLAMGLKVNGQKTVSNGRRTKVFVIGKRK